MMPVKSARQKMCLPDAKAAIEIESRSRRTAAPQSSPEKRGFGLSLCKLLDLQHCLALGRIPGVDLVIFEDGLAKMSGRLKVSEQVLRLDRLLEPSGKLSELDPLQVFCV